MEDITILMPCLNEEVALPYALENAKQAKLKLEEKGFKTEILLSDNGSEDKSIEIAESFGARVIRCPVKGYGNALIFGINNISTKYTIMGDADGSYQFTDAVLMVEKIKKESLDIVIGSRLKGKLEKGAMPLTSRIGNPIITFIQNCFYNTGFSDSQCGLRVFNTQKIKELNLISPGMEFASEMIIKSSLNNLKRGELPTTLLKDKRDRPPHLNPWKDGWRHLKFMLLFSPTWLFLIPSFLLIIFGLLMNILLLGKNFGTITNIMGLKIGDHYLIVGNFSMVSGFALLVYGIMMYAIGLKLNLRKPVGISYFLYKLFKVEVLGLFSIVLFLVGFSKMFYYLLIYTENSELIGNSSLRGAILACTIMSISCILFMGGFLVAIVKENWISIYQKSQI